MIQIKAALEGVSDMPSLEAQVLLAHVLGVNRTWVMAHPEAELTAAQYHNLAKCQARLVAGEPLPYILGHWEFFGLDLVVSPAVLIPRPETELLVESALQWLQRRRKTDNQVGGKSARLAVDVGAGSGCIAVSLAVNAPDLQVVACDLSAAALEVARSNIQAQHVADRIVLLQCDLLSPFARLPLHSPPFDLICANLPYIPVETLQSLRVYRSEPALALSGGLDGLESIRRLLQTAPTQLAPDGLLLLEIESSQGVEVSRLAGIAFPGVNVQVLPDLAGLERLVKVDLSALNT